MSAITQAMARAFQSAGVEISLAPPVAKVLVEEGRVVAVRPESGDEIPAVTVVANVGPTLFIAA